MASLAGDADFLVSFLRLTEALALTISRNFSAALFDLNSCENRNSPPKSTIIKMIKAAVVLPVNKETIAKTISKSERGLVTVFSSWTYHAIFFSRAISFSPYLSNLCLASGSLSPSNSVSNKWRTSSTSLWAMLISDADESLRVLGFWLLDELVV